MPGFVAEWMRLHKSRFLMLTALAVAFVATAMPATAQTNTPPKSSAAATSPAQNAASNPQSGVAVQSSSQPGANADEAANRNPVDISLEKQVTALFAHRAEFQNVRVSVNDAVVTLGGSVPTKIERRQAKALVRSVNGVKKVQEHLTLSGGGVTGPGTMATTPETAQNQPNAIGTNPGTTTDEAVGTQTSDTSAQPIAGGGTTGAILGATPPSSTVGSDVYMTAPVARPTTQAQSANFGLTKLDPVGLASKINAALKRDPALVNKNVSVNVSDTGVEVTGAVNTSKEKLTAMRIAQSYAGNFKVVDRLTLAGHTPPGTTNAQQTPQQANQTNSSAPPPNFAGNQVLPSGTAKNAPAQDPKNDASKSTNPR